MSHHTGPPSRLRPETLSIRDLRRVAVLCACPQNPGLPPTPPPPPPPPPPQPRLPSAPIWLW